MATKVSTKHKRKFDETLNSARLGAPESQYELGLMYANGIGVAQNFEHALLWLEKAAQAGLSSAQFLLATQYMSGLAVEKDEQAAFMWFSKAAAQGHAKAIYRLGKLHATSHQGLAYQSYLKAAELGVPEAQMALGSALQAGNGVAKDPSAASQWYGKAAQQGLAPAQVALAELALQASNHESQIAAALAWYRLAAKQDYPPAIVALWHQDKKGRGRAPANKPMHSPMHDERRRPAQRWDKVSDPGDVNSRYHLGLMFELGCEVAIDSSKAEHWYRLAAQQGDARAQLALARLSEAQDSDSAIACYEAAARQGQAEAQFALGRIFSSSDAALSKPLDGLYWYLQAGFQGDPKALLTLAYLFADSLPHLALECAKRAAQLGLAQAQFVLAQAYEQGHGVEQDLCLACDWYRCAAEQDDPQAQCALAVCLLHGLGVTQDLREAYYWFHKAAELGDPKAQWHLGSIYASGTNGVTQDWKQAFLWCQKAADLGFAPAQSTLGVFYATLGKVEEAIQSWTQAALTGDGQAHYNLAIMYATGQGLAQDPQRAFHGFLCAAEQGIEQAQSQLGLLYATGAGVAVDPIEAHKWLLIAARAGNTTAAANRDHSASQLNSAQLEEAQRRARAWKPSV